MTPRIRILADDLTGALDVAAAFGAGVPVHLGAPALPDPPGLDIVATATRDVPVDALPELLRPSLPWFYKAEPAFKKVDSLLRGNTFDEIDLLARSGGWPVLVLAPAFPAQGRLSHAGSQWVARAGGAPEQVCDMAAALQARGWTVHASAEPPAPDANRVAWLPEVTSDTALDRVAAAAAVQPGWLWCGSAGLAHALARNLPMEPRPAPLVAAGPGPVLLVSASHHAVSRTQWQRLRAAMPRATFVHAEDPAALDQSPGGEPVCIDLCASRVLTPSEAAELLGRQTAAIARSVPWPRTAVIVGGDTLLSLCQALGARGLVSLPPLARSGWGCAAMQGGAWDGLICHTRSGAFGGPDDLAEVVETLCQLAAI